MSTIHLSKRFSFHKTNMKIIFHRKENHGILSELGEKNAEQVTTIRSSLNENDLIERRRYDVHTFMRIVRLRKIKLPGLRNDSKNYLNGYRIFEYF